MNCDHNYACLQPQDHVSVEPPVKKKKWKRKPPKVFIYKPRKKQKKHPVDKDSSETLCSNAVPSCNSSVDLVTYATVPTEEVPVSDSTDFGKADTDGAEGNEMPQVEDSFERLKEEIVSMLTAPYCLHSQTNPDVINIVALYPPTDRTTVKLNVTVDRHYRAKVFVHRVEIPPDHAIWIGLPLSFSTGISIRSLIQRLTSFGVCVGNTDEQFQDLVPAGSVVTFMSDNNTGYREGDFGAIGLYGRPYTSTIRSTHCQMLVRFGGRCCSCSKFRNVLRCRRFRLDTKTVNTDKNETSNFLQKGLKHCNMSRQELIGKIYQQKTVISQLEKDVVQLSHMLQN